MALYLAHVGAGMTMRAIARARSRQPSTVMRAIRRVEVLRDDPLVERALSGLEVEAAPLIAARDEKQAARSAAHCEMAGASGALSCADRVALERLSEPGAFLLVASGAEKAGVFCAKNGFRKPLSLVSIAAATRFLTEDWVKCSIKTDLSARYALTATGRSMLRRLNVSIADGPPAGFAEAPSVFAGQHQMAAGRRIANPETGRIETIRVNLGESPLGWLARRKDGNGECLLKPEEVEAGERLREDYELAQIGPRVGQDWDRFLTPIDAVNGPGRSPGEGPMFARERFAKAAAALGPGLSDAAIRICCFHEGLEATERRMGWSSRSGKVVLKLALQRLVDHYGLMRRAA
ncbi:MAG: DUF6456 domain-containing protein [Paracoccaceae bacterium]